MVQVSCHTENEGDQIVVVFSQRLSGGESGLATTKEVILTLSLNVRLQDNCENGIFCKYVENVFKPIEYS